MIDIHNHLLYSVDDGSKSIEESIKLLNNMYDYGISDIILTPHYVYNTNYSSNVKNNLKILNELKSKVKVNLYLGNEVYIDENMYELLMDKEIRTLNGSNYLLFELPMNGKINNLENIIFNLRLKGIIPIIAHPERYELFFNDYDLIEKYRNMGVLFQGNLYSLGLKYGPYAKKILTKMLKDNYIDFLASDTHHTFDKNLYDKSIIILNKLVGIDKGNILLNINPKKIIDNEKIII